MLAADAVYHASALEPFLQTLALALAHADAQAFICHKRRTEALDARFEAELRDRWHAEEIPGDEYHPLYAAPYIVIWRLRNKKEAPPQ